MAGCLESILANEYPSDHLEVIIVDGMSTDGTQAIVEATAGVHPNVRLLVNARRITPAGLNLGIRASAGAYILWLSAHNTYAPGYIRGCVEAALRYGADNTGGGITTVARDPTFMAPFVVAALTHPFGVGPSAFRLERGEPRWVDTVFGGCYRRDVFERVGLFNESLARGQDMEFNLRLRRAGLRTLLVPSVHSIYHARSRFGEFLRHNWMNGAWALLPFLHAEGIPVRLRHLVPLVFTATLILASLSAAIVPRTGWLLLVLGVAYGVAAIGAATDVALRQRRWMYVVAMPFVFLSLHLSYGLGSCWGGARVAGVLLRRLAHRT